MPRIFRYAGSGGMPMGGGALVKCKLQKSKGEFEGTNTWNTANLTANPKLRIYLPSNLSSPHHSPCLSRADEISET